MCNTLPHEHKGGHGGQRHPFVPAALQSTAHNNVYMPLKARESLVLRRFIQSAK